MSGLILMGTWVLEHVVRLYFDKIVATPALLLATPYCLPGHTLGPENKTEIPSNKTLESISSTLYLPSLNP